MSTATTTTPVATGMKGGEWIVKESSPFETFTAEEFTEEQLMIKDMCIQFVAAEVFPILDRIDNLEPGLMKSLVKKAGEQGLLSTSFPEVPRCRSHPTWCVPGRSAARSSWRRFRHCSSRVGSGSGGTGGRGPRARGRGQAGPRGGRRNTLRRQSGCRESNRHTP